MSKVRMIVAACLLTLGMAHVAEAQRRLVGKVTGPGGEAGAGAQVQVRGTTLGAVADANGVFSLQLPAGAQVLEARRIGYRRASVAVAADATTIQIAMEKDVLQLERLVVTGTNTSVSSVNAANATASVSAAELNGAPSPTLENALQGKIPGAIISQNSGAPGGGNQVQLRGVTSINTSSSPLYIVDGVIVSNIALGTGLNSITSAGGGISSNQDQAANRIADLNPEDIENVEVLMGASAGAIYGSKASNGVILITTKKGTTGKPRFRVQQSMGQFSIAKKLGLRCFKTEAEATNWWQNTIGGTTLPYAWSPTCNDFEQQYYGGNGPSMQTDLSISGGSGQTTYFVSGSLKQDNAIQKNTWFRRQNLTANLSQVLGKNISMRVNNQFIRSATERGVSGNDNSPIVSPGDVFSNTPTWVPLNLLANGVYPRNPFLQEGTNPWQTAALLKNPEFVNRYIGSVQGTWQAYASSRQTLSFTATAGLDALWDEARTVSPPSLYFESFDGLPGTLVVSKSSNMNTNLNASGLHKFTTPRFTASTSFGLRAENRAFDQVFNQGRNVPEGVTDIQFGVQQALTETQVKTKDVSYYAQEEFLTWKERLMLTAAVNAERSSVNGDDQKLFIYPKASASLRSPWLPKFVDEAKLRVAWGRAGNQAPYGFKFTTLPTGSYDGILGARPSAIGGNPNIKPETSTELEGGLDLQGFDGRAAISVTAYDKRVTDLVLAAGLAPSSGYAVQNVNGGALRNTGIDYSLSVTPFQTRTMSWVSRTTFSTVSSTVTKLSVPCFISAPSFSLRFGQPYFCNGYATTTVAVSNGFDSTFVNGVYKSRVRHTSYFDAAPKFSMNFMDDFTWHGVKLHGLLEVRHGGKAVNLTGLYFDPTQLLADTALSNRRLTAYSQGYGAYLEPAGFAKLREVSLSYTIPRANLPRFASNLAELRVEVAGRNLYTWTKYNGYDPEVSNFGNQNVGRFQDVTPYPSSRSVFLTLSTSF